MVESDGRDHGDLGCDHVGRVEPAAQTGFDERDVAVLARKLQERHRRHELKKTRVIIRAIAPDFSRDGFEFIRIGDDLVFR